MIQLRPYQLDAIESVRGLIRAGHKRVLLQASTGAGKTLIASAILNSAIAKGKHGLFVAHRKEIISQTSAKLDDFNVPHGVIMAGHGRYHPQLPMQVASIQTITNRHKPHADIVIIDESHLACSKSFMKLIAHYKDSIIIGLTATPTRLDGQGLGIIYSDIISVISMSDLIKQGFLVKPRVFAPFVPDMSGIKTVRGDFDQNQVEGAMDKPTITGDIVNHWLKHAHGRKSMVFASSVKHSEHITEAFNDAGISARHLDGTTNHFIRDKTLAEYRSGKFQVLSNCGLFIEGLDIPEISCVIFACPTKSITKYLQAAGRGMRPVPGKHDLVILDHAGLTHIHGLVDEHREWTLEGKNKSKRSKADDEPVISVTICEKCFAAFSRKENPDECPECGEEIPKRRTGPAEQEGELVEITAEHLAKIKENKKQELKAARTTEQLIDLAVSRGYKYPGQWAKHIIDARRNYRV